MDANRLVLKKPHYFYSSRINSKDSLSFSQTVAYALPTVGLAFLMGPIAIIQGIYAKYFGLSLISIATVILIARLFDAVTDPLIGHVSDSYRRSGGSRKIFVITGGLLFVISSYFLYVPVGEAAHDGYRQISVFYFLVAFLAFYFSWTLFEIPHLAWASDIGGDANAKNKIYSIRALAVYIGMSLFYIVPLLPIFESSEFTPETLAWAVAAMGSLIVPMLFICVRVVPNRGHIPDGPRGQARNKIVINYFNLIFSNKPFLLFVCALFFAGMGVGMWFGLMFIFVDSYLGLGEAFALAYLIGFGVSILAVGLWYTTAKKLGKKIAWSLGIFISLLGVFGTGFLAPSQTGWLPLLFCLIAVKSGMASTVSLAPSLLADIIEYGSWKFGQDYAGTYFSLYNLVIKANLAIGAALSLAIAGFFGFEPASNSQTDLALLGLRASIAWLPCLFLLASIVFVILIPITSHHQAIILRRLSRINQISIRSL